MSALFTPLTIRETVFQNRVWVSPMCQYMATNGHIGAWHKALPDFGEPVVAFIYDYKWMEGRGVYYFDAFCQVCGDHVKERPGKDADIFADIHNISCGSYAQ